ncbi:hypothetical protein Salat_1675700 [Sesamum alatum]|uniref:Uncharacterized protein n=1 Tax=Sesamum alatum TaxID=300844 RepID=A0AAE2CJU1_9LAMI|nr:hypothetical protein Salat_1675700 [Sesamum alatum]
MARQPLDVAEGTPSRRAEVGRQGGHGDEGGRLGLLGWMGWGWTDLGPEGVGSGADRLGVTDGVRLGQGGCRKMGEGPSGVGTIGLGGRQGVKGGIEVRGGLESLDPGVVGEWSGLGQTAQIGEKQGAGEKVLGGGKGCAREVGFFGDSVAAWSRQQTPIMVGTSSSSTKFVESLGDTEERDCSGWKLAGAMLVNEEGESSVFRLTDNEGTLLEVRGSNRGEAQVRTNGFISSPLVEGPNLAANELPSIQMNLVGNGENMGAGGGGSVERELVASVLQQTDEADRRRFFWLLLGVWTHRCKKLMENQSGEPRLVVSGVEQLLIEYSHVVNTLRARR